jgi:hypothetical protein
LLSSEEEEECLLDLELHAFLIPLKCSSERLKGHLATSACSGKAGIVPCEDEDGFCVRG